MALILLHKGYVLQHCEALMKSRDYVLNMSVAKLNTLAELHSAIFIAINLASRDRQQLAVMKRSVRPNSE